ncbi:hypothetical protein BHM03_00015018 [Ensete ventricosum]|nr:hypothetical protein BHM03_00015018 [Ensete ventricosum]
MREALKPSADPRQIPASVAQLLASFPPNPVSSYPFPFRLGAPPSLPRHRSGSMAPHEKSEVGVYIAGPVSTVNERASCRIGYVTGWYRARKQLLHVIQGRMKYVRVLNPRLSDGLIYMELYASVDAYPPIRLPLVSTRHLSYEIVMMDRWREREPVMCYTCRRGESGKSSSHLFYSRRRKRERLVCGVEAVRERFLRMQRVRGRSRETWGVRTLVRRRPPRPDSDPERSWWFHPLPTLLGVCLSSNTNDPYAWLLLNVGLFRISNLLVKGDVLYQFGM